MRVSHVGAGGGCAKLDQPLNLVLPSVGGGRGMLCETLTACCCGCCVGRGQGVMGTLGPSSTVVARRC